MIATFKNKATQPFTPVQAKPAGACGKGQPCPPTHDEIARGAYDIYATTGWIQGQCTKNWLQAERTLNARNLAAHQPTPAPGAFAPLAGRVR